MRWGLFSSLKIFYFTLQNEVSFDRPAKSPMTDFLLETWGHWMTMSVACLVKAWLKLNQMFLTSCRTGTPTVNENFYFFNTENSLHHHYTTLTSSVISQNVFLFRSRRERSSAPSAGISATSLMTVTENVPYWTSTCTVMKGRSPGTRSFTLPVSVCMGPGHLAAEQSHWFTPAWPLRRPCPPPVFNVGNDSWCPLCELTVAISRSWDYLHIENWGDISPQ